MELQNIPVDRFQAFLLCAARIGSMLGTLPIFSGGQVPRKRDAAPRTGRGE
jgi:flagellar biosynthesis protein FliR